MFVSVADLRIPRGRQLKRLGCKPIFGQFSPKNCTKMKEIYDRKSVGVYSNTDVNTNNKI